MTRSGDERSPAATLPFGYRWHLEVSDDTYLLIEASRPSPPVGEEPGQSQPLTVEIDLLALGQEWDTGVVLSALEAGRLLTALGGTIPAQAPGWSFEPGQLTLRGHPRVCRVELTSALTAAMTRRLQSLLAGSKQ